ncbi:hypothetical protein SAMN04488688_105143 [Paenibacillus sp. cl141a]|nr:hypothetical protein SAMN04488688_105143 [Paenibacillus sp. cl141a]
MGLKPSFWLMTQGLAPSFYQIGYPILCGSGEEGHFILVKIGGRPLLGTRVSTLVFYWDEQVLGYSISSESKKVHMTSPA